MAKSVNFITGLFQALVRAKNQLKGNAIVGNRQPGENEIIMLFTYSLLISPLAA